MYTFKLRIAWAFLGLVAAIAVGSQLAKRLAEPVPEAVTAAAVEAALLKQLEAVPEVSIGKLEGEFRGSGGKEMAAAEEDSPRSAPLPAQERTWRELGLPVRTADCQLVRGRVEVMATLSANLRDKQWVSLPAGRPTPQRNGNGPGDYPSPLVQLAGRNRFSPVPTLMQMLQPEEEPTRMMLVEALAGLDDVMVAPALARDVMVAPALARRAVFDLSPSVRSRATIELVGRQPERYRPILLAALRHPWPLAARNAADVLIALEDREAIPALRQLLTEPDPSAPMVDGGRSVIRKMVRVNHLKNCLLCHAPSLRESDPLRGPVPSPHQPLPAQYYHGRNRSPDGMFVRADITYIRQDFSVVLPVKNAAPWPEMQRFDFLVRTRPATREELAAQKKAKNCHPQREAARRAIEALKQL